jgi:hypothetical protein
MKKSSPSRKKTQQAKPTRTAKRAPRPSRASAAVPAATAQPTPDPATGTRRWIEQWKQRKAEHVAMIEADPEKALSVAREQIDYGTLLLVELLERKTLFTQYRDVPGFPDGDSDPVGDCLASRFGTLAQHVAKYARAGRHDLILAVWSAAKLLTETIHDLAFDKDHARTLQTFTRRSMFLPSLRARPATFTYDFQTVADALCLSEDCLCDMSDRAAHKLDSPVTRLIAERVEIVGYIQDHLFFERERHAFTRSLLDNVTYMKRATPDEIEHTRRLAAMSVEDFLVKQGACRPEFVHYHDLPALTKDTVDEWWNKAVRDQVTRLFAELEGTHVYSLLKGNKPHEKLDDLRRRGKSALRSLAPPPLKTPTPLEGKPS